MLHVKGRPSRRRDAAGGAMLVSDGPGVDGSLMRESIAQSGSEGQ